MTTIRSVSEQITNLLDYLLYTDLAAYVNQVSRTETRVSWHSLDRSIPFLVTRDTPSLEDYQRWVKAGAYSAMLFDGSLLQITYNVQGGQITGHRLAYIPCPYRLDPEMVRQDPVLDIIDLHIESDPTSMVLHSAVRFDFDPEAAKPGHPSSHMTINSANCRIACAAPMHIGRFADFVFLNFYPDLRAAHRLYFEDGSRRNIGDRTLTEEERSRPHIAWI